MGEGVKQPGPDSAQVRPYCGGQLGPGLRQGQRDDDHDGDDPEPDPDVAT
jgi:hypothetical protein